MKMIAKDKVFIIAEAGVNHNGSIKIAKKLVDAAKETGADAIKFQTFKAESLVAAYAPKAEYQKRAAKNSAETQLEMLKKLELEDYEFEEIAKYAKKRKIVFLSSPFDKESVDALNKIGVRAFKIASGEITNLPLLKYIAGKRKPIILSTGMSDLKEISEALKIIRKEGVKDIVLLHCVTGYPADVEDVNLRAMDTMKCFFKLPVGFSDHTAGFAVSIAAAALGASVIEKHFTLDRNMKGPDHRASLEPHELKDMVHSIRNIEKAMGDGVKMPKKSEIEIRKAARKSIVAALNIPKAAVLTRAMLTIKRPGTGIEPKHLNSVVNKKTKTSIKKDQVLTWRMVEL